MARVPSSFLCVILVSLTCGFLMGQGALELTSTLNLVRAHAIRRGMVRHDDRLWALEVERRWQRQRDANGTRVPALEPWRVPRELQERLSVEFYTNTSATLLLQPQTNPVLYENPLTGQKAFICIPAKVRVVCMVILGD